MKARTIIAAASVALTLIVLPLSNAQAEEVEVVGQAAIIEGDKKGAEKKAVRDAFRRAIEKIAGVYVSSSTTTSNYQLLSDKIFTQTTGYVKGWKKYKNDKHGSWQWEDAGVLNVSILADVKRDVVRDDLMGQMAVISAKNMPRVLMMISEQQIGGGNQSWWMGEGNFQVDLSTMENTFINKLQPNGLKFVDRQSIQGKLSVGSGLGTDLNADKVKEFAGRSGAEVVIIGQAIATPVKDNVMGTKMTNAKANVTVKALNLDNGEIIATVVQNSSGARMHVDPTTAGQMALKHTGEEAAAKLFFKIIENWKKEVGGPSSVSLTIKNVKKFKDVRKIEAALNNRVSAVQNVNRRDYTKKEVFFTVDIEGGAAALADALEGKAFKAYAIEIVEMTANRIVANVTK